METEEQARREAIEGWRAGLAALHARIAGRFRRSEVRERARRYLAGLLERVERKNGWQLAEHAGYGHPRTIQRVLDRSAWDAEAVRDDLRALVVERLGDPGALDLEQRGQALGRDADEIAGVAIGQPEEEIGQPCRQLGGTRVGCGRSSGRPVEEALAEDFEQAQGHHRAALDDPL